MATNFNVKIGEVGVFTFIRRPDISVKIGEIGLFISDGCPGIRKWIAILHF